MRLSLRRGGFRHCLGPQWPQRQIGGLHKQIRRWGTIDVLYLGVICVGSSEAGHPLFGKHAAKSPRQTQRRGGQRARGAESMWAQPSDSRSAVREMMGCGALLLSHPHTFNLSLCSRLRHSKASVSSSTLEPGFLKRSNQSCCSHSHL